MSTQKKYHLHIEAAALGTGGLFGAIAVPVKSKVRMAYMVLNGSSSHATPAVLYVTYRTKSGLTTYDNNASTQCIAILKKTASIDQQGKMIYACAPGVNGDGASDGWVPTSDLILKPGYQVAWYGHTANGEALAGDLGVELEEIPEEYGNLTNMSETPA